MKNLTLKELNLEKKKNSNILNWRGQFSPDLVENIINKYSKPNTTIYDPFIGSGTTAYISLKLSRDIIGNELNPSAFILSKIYKFLNDGKKQKIKILDKVKKIIQKKSFNSNINNSLIILKRQKNYKINILLKYLLLISFDKKAPSFKEKLIKNYDKIKFNIINFPKSKNKYTLILGDARKTNIKSKSVDFVLTSPPYINVFNYHQNHRDFVEKLNYNILNIAKSELGSNRKFRGNRFFTVFQYSLDMFQVFTELRRICKKNATIIFVVGKVSSVRGTQIRNSKLIKELSNIAGFRTLKIQRRNFINKFGKKIYEDVIFLKPEITYNKISLSDVLNVPTLELKYIKKNFLNKIKNDIISDINYALENRENIKPSPIIKY